MKKLLIFKIGNRKMEKKNQVNSDFYVTICYTILELGIVY